MNEQTTKNIEVGKFCIIHDGSKHGHPGYVIWKDDNANLYLLLKFGSTPNEDNVLLKHKISQNIEKSYVYKHAFLGKRKDIGKELVYDISLNDDDSDILQSVITCNPLFSKSINRKDKRFYSLTVKIGKIKTAF